MIHNGIDYTPKDWVFKTRSPERLLELVHSLKTVEDLRRYYRASKIELSESTREALYNNGTMESKRQY